MIKKQKRNICQHDVRKSRCSKCGGGQICYHLRRRRRCKMCNPVKCKTCDKIYSKGDIKYHKCGTNKMSSGEYKIQEILESNNVVYKYDTPYKLKVNNYLRWDFIITNDLHVNKLMFIEYDGAQHFKPVRFGGISIKKANKNFIKQKKYDKLKDNFCKKNNYPLLRISYREFNNIENLVLAYLQR